MEWSAAFEKPEVEVEGCEEASMELHTIGIDLGRQFHLVGP